MAWRLFIDDERQPASGEWVIARSSSEAIEELQRRGCPVEIAFDHDLGGQDTSMLLVRWLADTLLDGRVHLPAGFTYTVHSQNPIGVANISGLMDGILRHLGATHVAMGERSGHAPMPIRPPGSIDVAKKDAMTNVRKPDFGPVLFCGDAHGRFDHIVQSAANLQASAVILLGDLEPQKPLYEGLEAMADRVWFIHGNHDTDAPASFIRLWDSPLAMRNIDGRVVTLPDGTRLAGLGGVFRQSVWMPSVDSSIEELRALWPQSPADLARATPAQKRWRDGPPLKHWSTIFPGTVAALAAQRCDVLVTHEAPGYHPHGFALLDQLARKMGAKVLLHGHQHDCLDSTSRWQAQGFASHGVGLRGISVIQEDRAAVHVRPGELDSARNLRRVIA